MKCHLNINIILIEPHNTIKHPIRDPDLEIALQIK